jgi:hypothetical protein
MQPRWFKTGNAWAADRRLLDYTSLYDRAILGGADKLIAFAAMGRHEEMDAYIGFSRAHANDYCSWSRRFHAETGGRIGCAEVDVFHLWHGDLRDRQYQARHAILREHDYDPAADIALDPQGAWCWNSPKHELHRRVREYFHSRMEDGRQAAEGAA